MYWVQGWHLSNGSDAFSSQWRIAMGYVYIILYMSSIVQLCRNMPKRKTVDISLVALLFWYMKKSLPITSHNNGLLCILWGSCLTCWSPHLKALAYTNMHEQSWTCLEMYWVQGWHLSNGSDAFSSQWRIAMGYVYIIIRYMSSIVQYSPPLPTHMHPQNRPLPKLAQVPLQLALAALKPACTSMQKLKQIEAVEHALQRLLNPPKNFESSPTYSSSEHVCGGT